MPTIIQIIGATGQTVYALIWNSVGQIWNVSNSAFENYSVSNWSHYAISAVEQSSSGSYFVSIPTGITTVGDYTFAGYVQAGVGPVTPPTDTPIAQGPFTITNQSFSIPSSLVGLISILRILCQDSPTSKLIRSEQLGGADQPMFPVDGVNTLFALKSVPLSDVFGAPSYIWVSIVGTGNVQRTQSGFTIVDPLNGIINFTTAPNPGSASATAGVYVDYNYEWFDDAKYAQFLYQAAQMTLKGTTDPTVVPNGLSDAMMQYALAQFWFSRASQYAEKYAATAGDSSEQVATVAQTYMNLGKAANSRADFLKADYYKGQGQRDSPGYGNIQNNWDPISPMR